MLFKSQTMNLNFKNAVGYLTFKELEKYDFIQHAFSTRLGGVSKNEFRSMNLSFNMGDDANCVFENYKIFCDALNFDINKLVRIKQVHKNSIKKITKNDFTSDFESNIFENFDGLITNEKEIVLQTFHADCPAIFMFDPERKVVGLAHAGWRGTVMQVAKSLAEAFNLYYGCNLENLICAIGPGIGKCCFEFSKSDMEPFEKLSLGDFWFQPANKEGKVYIDLMQVNKQILMKAGLLEKNIFKSDVCTKCYGDLMFSHRLMGQKRGNNAAFISIV